MDASLIVSILSLLLSIAVAATQVILWRRTGVVITCRGDVDLQLDGVVVIVTNRGRSEGTVSGWGFVFPDGTASPWVSEIAERYWPGAVAPDRGVKPPVPRDIPGMSSFRTMVPFHQIRSWMTAAGRDGQNVLPYVQMATDEVVRAKGWLTIPETTH